MPRTSILLPLFETIAAHHKQFTVQRNLVQADIKRCNTRMKKIKWTFPLETSLINPLSQIHFSFFGSSQVPKKSNHHLMFKCLLLIDRPIVVSLVLKRGQKTNKPAIHRYLTCPATGPVCGKDIERALE